jgi:rsbT co-antagonist protein RsbR
MSNETPLLEQLQADNAALRQRVAELEQQNTNLREQHTIMQRVIDTSTSIIYAKDTTGHYLLVNQQTANVLGKQHPADILGKTDVDLFPPELAAKFQDGDQTVLTTAKPLEREEQLLIGDTPATYLAQSFPIFDEQNTPIAVGGIATNITRIKQTEQQLRESESQNRALFEAIPDLIFRINREGVFVDYKAEHESDLAVPAEVFLGKHFQEVLPPEIADPSMQRITAALETGVVQEYQYNLIVEGEERSYEARYSVCGEHEVIAIIRDITQQKREEEERDRLQQQVIDAQQSAIRELSTPLIPLSSSVLLMPLVGSIDSRRAQLVMETLLEGIAAYQAEQAILDITGVSVVDTQVAHALVQSARAVQLLGAQIILTGIGPTMAQTLVHLGADLTSMTTRGSLQRAVAEALGQGT